MSLVERNRLVLEHQWLVKFWAWKYRRLIPFDDLFQEGNLGLIRAAEKYDHDRGLTFAKYATYWVRAMLRRAIGRRSIVSKWVQDYGYRSLPCSSLDAPNESGTLQTAPADDEPADEIIARQQLAREVRVALDRVHFRTNSIQRTVFTECLSNGATHTELAKRLGVSRQRAGQIEAQTRERLARCLASVQR